MRECKHFFVKLSISPHNTDIFCRKCGIIKKLHQETNDLFLKKMKKACEMMGE